MPLLIETTCHGFVVKLTRENMAGVFTGKLGFWFPCNVVRNFVDPAKTLTH